MQLIREFTPTDRFAIDELQNQLQAYFAEIDPIKESLAYKNLAAAHKYMDQMLSDVEKMHGQIYVAEQDGKVIGFIQGIIMEHKVDDDPIFDLTHAPRKEGWIGLLFVKPEHRSQGFGTKLLTKLQDYFKSQKCDCVRLLVLSDNPAVDFYRRHDFLSHNLEMVKRLDKIPSLLTLLI